MASLPLKVGMEDPKSGIFKTGNIKKAQKSLLAVGYQVPTTGVYGESTAAGVRQFQQASDLPATGVIDQRTWDAINKKAQGPKFLGSFMDAFSFSNSFASSALTGPSAYTPVDMSLPAEEAGPDWLIIGGVALGSLALIGGAVYLLKE